MPTSVDVTEGSSFDKGYLSPYFATEEETYNAVLDDAPESETHAGKTPNAADSTSTNSRDMRSDGQMMPTSCANSTNHEPWTSTSGLP